MSEFRLSSILRVKMISFFSASIVIQNVSSYLAGGFHGMLKPSKHPQMFVHITKGWDVGEGHGW